MKSSDGKTVSPWSRGVDMPTFGPLASDIDADVCVVGAGIAGLTTAYLLASENKRVVVLDAGPIGDGQTGRTSAHLASALDDRFTFIEKAFGEEGAKLAYQSHNRAIARIGEIAAKEQIDCEYKRVDGYLFLGPNQGPGQDLNELDEELAAAKRAGFFAAERVNSTPPGSFDSGFCIRFPHQGQFHPLKYLAGLTHAVKKLGVQIYCGNRVIDVQGTDEKKKTPATATTQSGPKGTAEAIVVATNTPAPINDWFGIYTKQSAYRSYVIGARIPRGSVVSALYWDMLDPYHYVRVESPEEGDHDLLIVGGEDHKTGQHPEGAAPFLHLEQWARQHFPMIQKVDFRWSGQVQEPADGLAYIGRAPTAHPNVYVVTGDSGMGLTHGTIAGMLITDMIQTRPNSWEKIYDPSRKPLDSTGAIKDFIAENTNVVSKYVEYLTPGEVKNEDDIRPGSGAVMRQGLKKLAVYRDEMGTVHRHSAVCTHMECIVAWNHVEATFDCPCHGARYDGNGKVIMGPAIDDLKPIED